MTDLAATGAMVRAQWLENRRQAAASLAAHKLRVGESSPMLGAVIAERRGDGGAVNRLLRSSYRLTPDDQETLAQFREGGFDDPPKLGRRKSNERWVAMQADRFLADWRDVNKRNGVSGHGSAEQMRDEAIEFIVSQLVPAGLAINRDTVVDYMTKRGKSRRN